MNSQLYTAASGLSVEQRRLDLIANNLANLSTTGYRAERLFSVTYEAADQRVAARVRAANASVATAGTYSMPGGPTRQTGRALDVSLEDGHFLAVETPGGRSYRRGGSLRLTDKGVLVDTTGHPVLNTEGQPFENLDPATRITREGSVVSGTGVRGSLLVVRDPQGVLQRTGDSLLSARGRGDALETTSGENVEPGWLEASGTEPLRELVRLIQSQRAFESYQKLISMTMNEVNRRAVNDLAG
ncbi:MAG: flagellar hook-basal body complex protein [bacterium]|nr:flagellar hook-basal body complex protein [bacterium]